MRHRAMIFGCLQQHLGRGGEKTLWSQADGHHRGLVVMPGGQIVVTAGGGAVDGRLRATADLVLLLRKAGQMQPENDQKGQ